MSKYFLSLGLSLFVLLGSIKADAELLGVGSIPGNSSDLSGLQGKQSDGTPHNRLGGLGSAITYSGRENEYVLASDRGPKDGMSDFLCRYHRMQIDVTPNKSPAVSLKLTATTLLTNEAGTPFVGSLWAYENNEPEKNLRLDAEGVRVGPQGQIYIADEYGPVIYEFDEKGKRRRSLPIPARFQTKQPAKTPAEEMPPRANSGRQPNRGMEGLAISPKGDKLIGIMQSPLIQDGGLNEKNERIGLNCRILELDLNKKITREFVYQLEEHTNGISEILAVNDHEFLVLERDSLAGKMTKFKQIFHINTKDASDVTRVDRLPTRDLPTSINSVKKKLLIDLLAAKHKIAGDDCPEKFEGLTFGPDLPDGRRLLLVTADNDFVATAPFRVYAFAIDRGDLPNLQLQRFDFAK